MAYLTREQLQEMGFKKIGENVKISDKASIYDCDRIEIGNNSRIDDFCVVSGKISIGMHVHLTPGCLVAGGEPGIVFHDFTTLAYGVKIFTQSDDYSGETLCNSTIPVELKKEYKSEVVIHKHSIVGAGSVIMPGVILAEGTSVGAMSLVLKSTDPWYIYVGIPANKLRARSQKMLDVEMLFIQGKGN